MRTKYNGFVKFWRRIDGKKAHPKRAFRHKEEWPGECSPQSFIDLIRRITQDYSVGDTLSEYDQLQVDRTIVWDSHPCEMEFLNLYNGEPITPLMMELFQNWAWRLDNGERPQEYNNEATF